MNGPLDPWLKWLATIICAAIVLQLLVAALRPLIPYILAVLALGGLLVAVEWWRNRW